MVEITVILPVYNGKPYLKKSVESVLGQEFSNFEFLILDDCSTDGSYAYLQSLNDPRIRLSRNAVNRGLFPNLNILIKESTAPLIKIWSQDDIMQPDCLFEFVQFHKRHPGLGFSYSGREKIDENGNPKDILPLDLTPEIIPTPLHTRIAYFTGSIAGNIANVCLERKAMEQVGGFDEKMKISGDFFMWVKLAQYFPVGFINKPLIQLRDHKGQLSRKESYYAHHVVEDLIVYRYLDGYASETERKLGKETMERHKLLFYYVIMVKALLKGNFRIAAKIRNALTGYCNMGRLRKNFLRYKIFKRPAIPFEMNLH